jgi:hypothetical protein
VDVDAGKIARARRAWPARCALRLLDVQAPLPAQAGHVLLLDVLQYLDAGPQQALLRAASMRVAPGGRLLLRTPLATGDGRDRTTRVADRLAWLVGWMGTRRAISRPAGAAGDTGRGRTVRRPRAAARAHAVQQLAAGGRTPAPAPSADAGATLQDDRQPCSAEPMLGCSHHQGPALRTGSRAFSPARPAPAARVR